MASNCTKCGPCGPPLFAEEYLQQRIANAVAALELANGSGGLRSKESDGHKILIKTNEKVILDTLNMWIGHLREHYSNPVYIGQIVSVLPPPYLDYMRESRPLVWRS